MTTSLRRNTFTLKGSDFPKNLISQNGHDRQNIMRLKVNRIAIVQELKVEHVLEQLHDEGILTSKEKRNIEAGTTPSDRARRLIDILPTKPKESNWYKHFRDSLLNPNANVEFRKRYRDVVEFLDNTVIHRPSSQAAKFSDVDSKVQSLQYPKYEPLPNIPSDDTDHTDEEKDAGEPDKGIQNILYLEQTNSTSLTAENSEGETEKGMRDSNLTKMTEDGSSIWSEEKQEPLTLIKGFFHQWVPMPDNFRSLIEIPHNQIQTLTDSNLKDDKELLEAEKKVFQKMRKFEVVAALNRRKQLPQGFEIAMCEALQEILIEPELYHLYMKYFKNIHMSGINLLRDIITSFKAVLSGLETEKSTQMTKQVTNTGLRIVDFFVEFSCFIEAEEVLNCLLSFLNTTSCIDTWMAKYKGYIKLMHLRNKNFDFYGSQQAYFLSVEMTWAIQMMSFTQDLIDEADAFTGLSNMLMEIGSITPAAGWANRALQAVNPHSHMLVVDCLCSAVMSCCAQWQVKKAEILAVQAVQMAREFAGKRHPLYIKALLHFCYFSSEFMQDEDGVKAARECLMVASRTYHCETLQLALAHRAVSRALMVTQQFDKDDFYTHAMEAIRIARALLPLGHPMLHLFLYTFASALQWKALNCPSDEQDSTLRWAEAEAKQALAIVSACYGEISLKTAQVYSLLGQIYSKMNRLEEAEMFLAKSVSYMKLCQPPSGHYYLLSTATLATFYKIVHKPAQALPLLKQVVNDFESTGFYVRWVHMCYDNMIKLYQAEGHNKRADDIQATLTQWLKDNPAPNHRITLNTLDKKAQKHKEFMEEFDKWGTKVKRVVKEIADTDN